MPDYRKMLAHLFEAAAAACKFPEMPDLGILKWKESCEGCKEGPKCPARSVLFQAFSIELTLEPEDEWASGNVEFLLTHPLSPSTSSR